MIVKVWGPYFMKDRPAFQFRRLLIAYNFVQVVFSSWLFYEVTFYCFNLSPTHLPPPLPLRLPEKLSNIILLIIEFNIELIKYRNVQYLTTSSSSSLSSLQVSN